MSLKKKIYLVGGAVRDKLMGVAINDKDYVAVGYEAKEFSHLQRVGKDFPVFLQDDGSELALARVEKKIASGYNGFSTQIKNVSLEDDLKRRDLTINSIAYDEQNNSYIDPYKGQEDIKNKILRHTSKAFIEDPLRVLRLARFRAKLGKEWSIDNSTKKLISLMKEELQYLQIDRVYKEIKKASSYKEFHLLFETLEELGVIHHIFPTIAILTQDKIKYKATMELLQCFKNESLELKLCAIYYYVQEIKQDNSLDIDIKVSKKTGAFIITLLQKHKLFNSISVLNEFEIAKLFSSFRRDKELLTKMLYFNKVLYSIEKNNIPLTTKEFNDDVILDIFDEISSYSPQIWIESLLTKPSNSKIAKHIENYNLRVISKYKQLYNKPFILKN